MQITRAAFLRFIASATMVLSSHAALAAACSISEDEKVKENVLAKLKEKFPSHTFLIKNITFNEKATHPYWYVQATTTGPAQKTVFAMHYCNGNIELTAPSVYGQ